MFCHRSSRECLINPKQSISNNIRIRSIRLVRTLIPCLNKELSSTFYWRSNGNKKGHTSTYVVNQCYRIIESAHCQIWKYRSHIHFALIFLAFLITRLVSNNLSDLVKTVIDCPKKAVRYFAPNFDKNARTYEKESRYREWVPCSPESAINIIWCCWLHPCLSWGEQKGSRTELPDIFNVYSPSLVSCNRLD